MPTACSIETAKNLAFQGLRQALLTRPRPTENVRDDSGPSRVERLVQIAQSNDLLLSLLPEARRRVEQAEKYLADPRSRSDLGMALVAHAQRQRAWILERLQGNRAEAIAILADDSDSR